jgi:enamine deaminase RidA (YjgF/YER057c/UK114 family)
MRVHQLNLGHPHWRTYHTEESTMAHEYIQPPEIFAAEPLGFTQVVKAAPGAQLFVSGQASFNADFKLVGEDDLITQATQALENLGHALRAGGATPADLTSLRIYIVDYEPRHAMELGKPLRDFLGGAAPPAQTLLGIQALGMPGMLIEIEATAVIGS